MSATVVTASDTAYFDTVSLRLLRNDLTLSVDNGSWCLATPDGPVRFAGTGLAVPPALARLVRAYTRDDDLVAVARVGDGGTTELHALLDHRIARSPRPLDDSARGVVLRYVRAQIAALAAADLAARQDKPDAVHRMRVATRRLRGVFSVYARVLGGRRLLKALGDELRWLGGELGPARDIEVQWARSRPWVGERTNACFAVLSEEARERARCALDGRRYLQLLTALDVLEVVLSEKPRRKWPTAARRPAARVLPHLARTAAEKVDARVSGLAAHSAGPGRDRAVHDVRKAAKRLRYALEAGAEALPVDAKPALRAFQDLLGEFQDAVVARELLSALEVADGDLAAVRARETVNADRCVAALPKAWHDLRRALRPLWT
ncbi:CHAD domain-containing protein [Amycolatopsis pittospori]|uniref:CHAD domain-containing protein n=1 Tax=Amycolatopsis pittospori TaxID=2749434 RepID=UPI0015F0A8A4|nr:CHAD domain-containing protein [Amycolatopsis pittospori]